MDQGRPLARMIAVQIKATLEGKYAAETSSGFTYLLRSSDLDYWRGSNLPIIIVLFRKSDDAFFWKAVEGGIGEGERKLVFDKQADVLDRGAVDRLAALTVPKTGFGYYVPPLGGGEEALVNILPITPPPEIFVSSTSLSPKSAAATLYRHEAKPRFDWVIKNGTFWSFTDPRSTECQHIVDLDQVDAVDTNYLAFHEDIDEQNNFAFLLKQAFGHQFRADLGWDKKAKLFYFRALAENEPLTFYYDASKKRTDADVVNVSRSKTGNTVVEFVRHHAFVPRFDSFYNQWFLVVNPTYYFTTNGFITHSHPHALLSGKKRMDNSGALRGQVIMWHRFLSAAQRAETGLFAQAPDPALLRFGTPPIVELPTRVPEDVWGLPKKPTVTEVPEGQKELAL
jgi:hypothetical protein